MSSRRDVPRMMMIGAAVGWAGWKLFQRRREESLAGEVVLITGGSRGLGLLLAREFAGNGCRIVICARDEQELQHARGDLVDRGADVLALHCDVSDRTQVEAMIADATAHFGRIDILVNNAGIIQMGPLSAMSIEDLERTMAINFWGAAYATFAVLPQMRARRSGRIVNITSIGGKVSVPHLVPYDCAKFALVGFSEGLHAELAQHGVRVTTIVPGLMRTGSAPNAWFKGDHAREFQWFSLASATPLTAIHATRAARRIVAATKRGEAEVTLSWQARTLRTLHGVAPGAVTNALAAANRLLPAAPPYETPERRGMQLATPLVPSPLTTLLNRAARETHQYVGTPRPAPQHAQQAGLPASRQSVAEPLIANRGDDNDG